ncbi:MAG: dTDP-glucose 4,6-dehydratase [candidate division Zixibacteria bacterium]|nr:dTDP-glucose 4,6-dehydratase [candidate division Zixibacteria bacterium]
MNTLLVTGGAGFIGSNFVRYLIERYPECRVIVLDALTYAGNPANLEGLEQTGRMEFIHGNIGDRTLVDTLMKRVDAVVNFAAESHVDRSILNADTFIETNIRGTFVLLESARQHEIERFHQISTDEVYGDVPHGSSLETDPFRPRSPYASSKAGAELLALSYYTTYKLPVVITRGGNTIGPYQYPEKVVPVFITNALEDKPLPVYGKGTAVRSYLYVEDHCAGIDLTLRKGQPGEAYNIGTAFEISGLTLVDRILAGLGKPPSLRQFVTDRPGHDLRYSLDCAKIGTLGWKPRYSFDEMIERTIRWYIDHESWWRAIKNDQDYQTYYRCQYHERTQTPSTS